MERESGTKKGLMKEPTDIRKTWQPYLQSGEIIEKEFLAIVRKFYPQAGKILGNYKYADILVPELGKLLIEVKRDLKSDMTGNLAFEIYFRGKPSGLLTTKAKIWVMTDQRKFYLFDTDKLRSFFRENKNYLVIKNGGDGNEAKMVIINKVQITNWGFCCGIFRNGENSDLLPFFLKSI